MAISGVNRIVGTEVNDTLRGDAQNNWLIGRGGNDSLSGLAGNDRLDGGDGNDLLSGGTGSDTLAGGNGNDFYIVGAGDLVLESDGGGLDTVITSAGRSLESYIENLTLVGAIDGSGNGLGNVITGSDLANAIAGGLGDDRIVGGRGDDTLTGDGGADRFVFTAGFGNDVITDFKIEGADHDTLEFAGAFGSGTLNHDRVLELSTDTAQGVSLALETGNTLLIAGTTLAELRAHPETFAFFAG
jgi:Ca2+-binding RTX toxin-like protein